MLFNRLPKRSLNLDPRRPGHREAIFQHQKARDLGARNRQDDRKGRFNDLAGHPDPPGELADDRRPPITRQDVLHVEPNGFGHAADETGNGATARPRSDPRQRGGIAGRNLPERRFGPPVSRVGLPLPTRQQSRSRWHRIHERTERADTRQRGAVHAAAALPSARDHASMTRVS
jgi:hypothetical protein